MICFSIKHLVLACIILCVICVVCAVAALIVYLVRRVISKRKVRCMCMEQKITLLNELAEPYGFCYIPEEDVFSSCLDAWQRDYGYETMYDRASASINCVTDALPVYFDYDGKTWLIELWKGQYGINTGGEAGIYHARNCVPEGMYKRTHFEAVCNDEMPVIQTWLERKQEYVYCLKRRHWWLTGFKMGVFSRPKNLRLMTKFCFSTTEQAEAYYEGLIRCGVPRNKFRICKNEVYVRLDFSPKLPILSRLHRACVQLLNRFYCWLFRFVTHPFKCTVDRMLYLYFLLPSCFRRMLRLKRKPNCRRCRQSQPYGRSGQQPGLW